MVSASGHAQETPTTIHRILTAAQFGNYPDLSEESISVRKVD